MTGRSRGHARRARPKPPDPELESARNAFLDAVSAQILTPLTLMLGPLRESLADDRLPPEERHRVAMAHRAALQLLNLVDTLAEMARIDLGTVQISIEPVDLGQLADDVVSRFQSLMKLAGLPLVLNRLLASPESITFLPLPSRSTAVTSWPRPRSAASTCAPERSETSRSADFPPRSTASFTAIAPRAQPRSPAPR